MPSSDPSILEDNLERFVRAWAIPISQDHVDRSCEEFLKRLGARGSPARSGRPRLVALVAALLVCACVLYAVVMFSPDDPERATPAAAGQDATTKQVDDWIRELGSDSPETRSQAARRLAETGEAALPALRRAAREHSDITARATARDLVESLERERLWGALGLTEAERTFLAETRLLTALESLASKRPRGERIDLPDDKIWSLLARSTFEKAEVARVEETGFSARTDAATLVVQVRPAPDDGSGIGSFRWSDKYPRHYLLEMAEPLDLSDKMIRWDYDRQGLPCLQRFGFQGKDLILDGRRDLSDRSVPWVRRFEKDGKTTGVLYSFHWNQDKPFPSLRHLFVKERWALMVLDYQD